MTDDELLLTIALAAKAAFEAGIGPQKIAAAIERGGEAMEADASLTA